MAHPPLHLALVGAAPPAARALRPGNVDPGTLGSSGRVPVEEAYAVCRAEPLGGLPGAVGGGVRRTLLFALALAVLGPQVLVADDAGDPGAGPPGVVTPEEELPRGDATYVQPNTRLPNGRLAYAHVTPDHMPWRVAIARPKTPPKYASSEKTREVSIEAMRLWETAIQKRLPWFRLEFVEKDPTAPVQVQWKRKVPGPWSGFGRILYREEDGVAWVGGEMQISTTPSNFVTLEIDEVRLLVAHEFGHVLGLGHCLDCDSAMNYSWATRGRILVTDLDVDTFVELVGIANGTPAE